MFSKNTLGHLPRKNAALTPSTLGTMAKLPKSTKACLVFEHCLRICLASETLFLGLVFSRIPSSVSRAFTHTGSSCLQQRLPALIHVSPALRAPPLPRGHPDLGISLATPTTDCPSCCKGWQLSALSCQASGMPSTARSPLSKVIPASLSDAQSGPASSC